MQTVPIQMPDGSTVPVSLFPGEGRDDAPVIVVLPGLGIPGGYYRLFAEALVARGFHAAIGDLRGQGDSVPKPSSASRYGYQELVSVDFPAIFEVVREQFPEATPFLLGHSMGGQLASMYAARVRGRLGGLILVASGTPYFRGYRGVFGPGVLVGTAAVAVASNLAGFWPGDLLGKRAYGRQSKVLMSDWARLARTGRFVPVGADIDYDERMSRLKFPVLSITIAGDDLAPQTSADHLLGKLPGTQVTRWFQPEALGHNGWITDPDSTVDTVEKWLRDR